MLIYVAQIIKVSMWCQKTTLSEWYDCNMHIDLCVSSHIVSLSGWQKFSQTWVAYNGIVGFVILFQGYV